MTKKLTIDKVRYFADQAQIAKKALADGNEAGRVNVLKELNTWLVVMLSARPTKKQEPGIPHPE